MKKQISIDKVYKVIELANELTSEDLKVVDEMIIDQKNTISPLRMAEASRVRKIGEHNERMVSKLKELKEVIEDYEE